MTARGEHVLLNSLIDPVSLEVLAQAQIDLSIVPTGELRPVVEYALDYFARSGRTSAPTEAVLEPWRAVLEDSGYWPLSVPEESIEWAIEDLKDSFGKSLASEWTKVFAESIHRAPPSTIPSVYDEAIESLMALRIAMEDGSRAVDVREGLRSRLDAYDVRAQNVDQHIGATLGIPEIDQYTHQIHPGELAILGAGPKVGKSFFLDFVALRAWMAGGSPALFTLENSVDMTLDRMAILLAQVSARAFSRAQLTDEDYRHARAIITEVTSDRKNPLIILQPEVGKRSFPHMVQSALIRGADFILVDQLTFVELGNSRRGAKKTEAIGDALHELKAMISSGRDRVPCLLAHQINREGVKAAEKDGCVQMYHMAESAEVERTADWVFGLYQSEALKHSKSALFQTLASRREGLQDFTLRWDVAEGLIDFRHIGRPNMAVSGR